MPSFPFYKQHDAMDCGPSCLRMIARYYGRSYNLQTLREKSFLSREGVSMLGISDAAESIGLRTLGVSLAPEKLFLQAPLPLIAHCKQQQNGSVSSELSGVKSICVRSGIRTYHLYKERVSGRMDQYNPGWGKTGTGAADRTNTRFLCQGRGEDQEKQLPLSLFLS